MDFIVYRVNIRDEAQKIIISWDFNNAILDGALGKGVYFYFDPSTRESPGNEYLRQIESIGSEYSICQIQAIVRLGENHKILDLDIVNMFQDLEDVKNKLRQKSTQDEYLSRICSDPFNLEKVAISLYCKRLPVAVVKKSMNFKSFVKRSSLQDKLITHICVLSQDCIEKSSLKIIKEEG